MDIALNCRLIGCPWTLVISLMASLLSFSGTVCFVQLVAGLAIRVALGKLVSVALGQLVSVALGQLVSVALGQLVRLKRRRFGCFFAPTTSPVAMKLSGRRPD